MPKAMVQESWSWDHGKVPIQDFLFPFIKHAVLNGKTSHTKGCLENRCATILNRKKPQLNIFTLTTPSQEHTTT